MKKEDKVAQSLLDRGQKCYVEDNITEGIKLLSAIEQIPAFEHIDPVIKMKALNLKGLCYIKKSEFNAARENILRSLEIAKQIGDPKATYMRYENLAAISVADHQPQKAIESLQQAIRLKESSGNYADIPRSMIQLSSLQFALENNEAGKEALKKAAILILKYEVKGLSAILHFNTAMQLKREKKYTQALKEYGMSYEYAQVNNDSSVAIKACNNQGDLYMILGKWKEAREKFTQCLRLAQDLHLNPYILTSSVQLAMIALKLKDIAQSRKLFDYVTAHAHEAGDLVLHKDLAELSVELYEAEGDYPAALKAHRKYVTYYKKSYDNELSRAVLEIQAKYETEKSERELQKANLKQVESELKALRAQMDPHFIFNALSSMRREMLEGNIENADKYLVRFSKLLRMILDTSRQPQVRLSDNIELLHLYIQIENSRQGNRFDYEITAKGIDPESIYIPGLILQPLAENAIIHGLNPKKGSRGKLKIIFSKTGKMLKVQVSDNGAGRQASREKAKENHTSHAMNIIKETLDLIWKDEPAKNFFVVKDLKDKNNNNNGTEVTVLLPLSSKI